MIVSREWHGDGDEQMYFMLDAPPSGTESSMLEGYREVPLWLWNTYSTALALVDVLTKEIDKCPQLPRYIRYVEERERERERARQADEEVTARVAKDRLTQEQLRVAGILKPLPLDCPDDEPMRIPGPDEVPPV